MSSLQSRVPLREVDGVQLALGAERVDHAVGNDRDGARTFVESEVVAIASWGRRSATSSAPVFGVERLEDFFVADAMKEDDAIPGRPPARRSPVRPACARRPSGPSAPQVSASGGPA